MTITSLMVRTVIAASAAITLAGCGGGASGACDVLTEDSKTSATVFSPIIPTDVGQEAEATQRLDLLEKVDSPPSEVKDEWDTWVDYLEAVKAKPQDPKVALTAVSDPDIKEAGDTLSKFYTQKCM